MKAEERHRLHENELQRLTEHARERSRPFLEQYGTTLLFALAGLLVVAAVVIWFWKRGGSGSQVGWAELDAAFRNPNATAEDFANVAEVAQGSPAATWARLYEGEAHLGSGMESLFADKEGALRDLGDARKAFEAVLAEKDAAPEITVRALYGLGRTLEATSDGDLKPALDRYEQIVSEHGDTVYAKLARERVDSLKSAEAKAFYAWFSKQKPVVDDPIKRPADAGPATGAATGAAASAAGPALGGATGQGTPPAASATPSSETSTDAPSAPATRETGPAEPDASAADATDEAAPAADSTEAPASNAAPSPQ